MAEEVSEFFSASKNVLLLVDIKLKLNREAEKRLRLDFRMPLTAEVLDGAPEAVKEAFYAVSKDGHVLNPIGVVKEYQGAKVRFYATSLTKEHEMAIEECVIRQLEVTRPKNKVDLADGDVSLNFHINAPASKKLLVYAYENFGQNVFGQFEDAQPFLPGVKASAEEKADDGQANLNLSQNAEQKAATSKEADKEFAAPKKNAKKKSKKH